MKFRRKTVAEAYSAAGGLLFLVFMKSAGQAKSNVILRMAKSSEGPSNGVHWRPY